MSLLQAFIGGAYPAGTTHEINNQTDFDNLTIGASDIINFNVSVIGNLTIDQPNVRVNGNNNLISGSNDFAPTWTDNGDGTYEAANAEPKWLTKDNSLIKMAETVWIYPTGSTATNKLTISHGDVSGYGDIVGSILAYKERPWKVDAYIITAYDGAGTITLNKDLLNSYDARGWFKLLGKEAYFSGDNEWAYDGANIVIKSAAEPTDIKIIDEDYGITVNSSFCKINELNTSEYYEAGIVRIAGGDLYINGSEVSECRGVGILLNGIENNASITDNNIHDIGFCGINSLVTINPTITGNTVTNIGTANNYGWNQLDSTKLFYANNCAIVVDCFNDDAANFSDGGDISDNTITNIAYCGIKIRGQNNTARRNHIDNAMSRFVDGGGLYSFGGNINADVVDADANIYEYNIVHGCIGNTEGLTGATSKARGIYLDDESINSIVRYNTIYDNQQAGLLKGKNHTVEYNILDSELEGWQWVTQTSQVPSMINDGNNFNYNQLVTRDNANPPFTTDVIASDPDYNPYDGGSADNNYYINPYGTRIGNDTNFGDMTFAQLQTLYGEDANSTEQTDWITAPGTPATDVILYTNPTGAAVNQLIPSGYMDVDGVDISGQTKSIAAWYGLLILKI